MIGSLSRRSWLGGSAAMFAGTMLPFAAARGQGIATLKVGAGLIEPQAEAYYAEALGIFRDHGLSVSISKMRNGAAQAAAVAGGALNIGCSSILQLAQAHQHGLPFVIVVPGGIHDSRYPGSGLVVDVASPVTSPGQLNGKIIGVATLNGLDQLLASVLIDKSGGDSSSVKFVEIAPSELVSAVTQGRVAAANLEDPELSAGLATRRVRSLGDGEDAIAKVFVETGWFATKDWLERNKETARRFSQAIYAAGAWAMANPEKAATILQRELTFKRTRATERFATQFNLAEFQPLLEAAARYKVIAPAKAADFVWSGR